MSQPNAYALAFFGGVTRLTGSSVGQRAGSHQFAGEPINVTVVAHSYRWAWLDQNRFDVFQHCWSVEVETDFRRLYAPVSATFEPNAERLAEIRSRLRPGYHDCVRGTRGVNREFCMFNTASMAFSIQQVLRLVGSHEDSRGSRYDKVVLSRPDLVFTERPPPLSDAVAYPRGQVSVELVNISAMRGFSDTIFVLPSSGAARRMARIFAHLSPNASFAWGWFASFIATEVTPGVWPQERIRGVDISRRLCSRSLAARIPPGRTAADAITSERFALLQSWGYECDYLRRLPRFDDRVQSRCCTLCDACPDTDGVANAARRSTSARDGGKEWA